MKTIIRIATILFITTLGTAICPQAQTIIDIDGNSYETIGIGEQVWMKENLKTTHYADGSEVSDVRIYDDSEENEETYGCLYHWDAAMKNSIEEGAQGVCPEGWHIPSEEEWDVLSDYLGGHELAGGKMKEQGTSHWIEPNTDASNVCAFTALPGGEHDTQNFRLLGEYAVFWSSTETSSQNAKYKYLSYKDATLHPYNFSKSFYYSVRCIKNKITKVDKPQTGGLLIYPNPFDQILRFDMPAEKMMHVKAKIIVFNNEGEKITAFEVGSNKQTENLDFLPAGIYYVRIESDDKLEFRKIIKN